jgi:CRP-like cAMP-binding protein
METVKFFKLLSNDHKEAIAGSLISHLFTKGETIIHESEPGSCFYIIKEG